MEQLEEIIEMDEFKAIFEDSCLEVPTTVDELDETLSYMLEDTDEDYTNFVEAIKKFGLKVKYYDAFASDQEDAAEKSKQESVPNTGINSDATPAPT
eukprot:CAMPEP_0176396448 /NCGR_PEP_ID=MMETSP0126-20121128/44266_1 /TAXON_ID=141414 ORGANISM="Strombidinopsis acuminatum, Strain SPMC142" /NCGR_SAMPLE_ID=MMETSP0126 /ASSEMBLY_ACC=CAM_ASM_000229 /LENGTH=96 /DNA_ID=CAMNT_0017770031 /DNA_START=135 /DNA_END=425 /DNA_ORIENTATION=-